MLTRFLGWLFGKDRRESPRPDPVALSVERRQRAVARRLAPIVGKSPDELLDGLSDAERRRRELAMRVQVIRRDGQ